MELPALVSAPIDGSQTCLVDLGFPSPAADDLPLTTPCLEEIPGSALTASPSWGLDAISSAAPSSPMPGSIKPQPIATPVTESLPSLGLDAIVGASIDPAPSYQKRNGPFATVTKPRAGLRLPSFDMLGISNPRPTQASQSSVYGAEAPDLESLIESPSEDSQRLGMDTLSLAQSSIYTPGASPGALTIRDHMRRVSNELTPPDESEKVVWDPITRSCAIDTEAVPGPGSIPPAAAAQTTAANSSVQPRIQIQRTESQNKQAECLEGATAILSMTRLATMRTDCR